jgi:hypothetical protein
MSTKLPVLEGGGGNTLNTRAWTALFSQNKNKYNRPLSTRGCRFVANSVRPNNMPVEFVNLSSLICESFIHFGNIAPINIPKNMLRRRLKFRVRSARGKR